jgi:chemotaxis protein MotB
MAHKPVKKSQLEAIREEASLEAMDEARWLFSLSDLLTLLLTFFIMLFAISSPDAQKMADIMQGIGGAMGGAKKAAPKAVDPMGVTRQRMQAVITDNNLVNDIEMTSDSRGIVLYSRGDFFFAPGAVDLLPDTKLFLKKVAGIIRPMPNTVLVEGHTDDLPTHTVQFASNWELSAARAASVVRYFIEEEKLDPKQFIVSGYAEYKPRVPPTPENRGQNRRVEIVIMKGAQL